MISFKNLQILMTLDLIFSSPFDTTFVKDFAMLNDFFFLNQILRNLHTND